MSSWRADPGADLGRRWQDSLGQGARVVAHALSAGLLFRAHVGPRHAPVVKLVRAMWGACALALMAWFGPRQALLLGAAMSGGFVLAALGALGAMVWVASLLGADV